MKIVLAFTKQASKPRGRIGVARRKGEMVYRSEFSDHAAIGPLCRQWRKHCTVVVIDRRLLAKRLQQMNWHFGRGDVRRVVWDTPTSGWVVRCIYTGGAERRRFRIVEDTLHFLGHRSYLGRPLRL